jgi:crotonobetainyl-CoA:carnitine CoA-transferase CaiB-like acyl-CoA transferase
MPHPDEVSTLPLAGIRVLDLSRLLPGGFCSLLLADYGADVLKVGRGLHELAGGIACYRPYACAGGGWVTLAALEPRFWAAWCRGVGREDLVEHAFAAPRSDATRRSRRSSPRARTPPDTNRLPGPALGEHSEEILRAAGYDDARIAELLRSGAVAGPHEGAPGGSFLA